MKQADVQVGAIFIPRSSWPVHTHRRVVAVIGDKVAFSVGDDRGTRVITRRALTRWGSRHER